MQDFTSSCDGLFSIKEHKAKSTKTTTPPCKHELGSKRGRTELLKDPLHLKSPGAVTDDIFPLRGFSHPQFSRGWASCWQWGHPSSSASGHTRRQAVLRSVSRDLNLLNKWRRSFISRTGTAFQVQMLTNWILTPDADWLDSGKCLVTGHGRHLPPRYWVLLLESLHSTLCFTFSFKNSINYNKEFGNDLMNERYAIAKNTWPRSCLSFKWLSTKTWTGFTVMVRMFLRQVWWRILTF